MEITEGRIHKARLLGRSAASGVHMVINFAATGVWELRYHDLLRTEYSISDPQGRKVNWAMVRESVWKESGRRVEGEWKESGRRVEGEWKESGRRVEGEWKASGRRVEGEWKASGRRVEGEWKESGRRVEGEWKESGRRVEGEWKKRGKREQIGKLQEPPKSSGHIL
ncbi:hypothetical protein N7519_007070 [Penicillium mononematosum]|uniref:uncharacterized protein n=1 Tax=Penicillium mononematosum TaxID=268346 RepID=UPI0025499C47|nr:uncharacterized protein N7519_007070 [Penicillium mononematosum]KAJ6185769.1 hypothetical protein N7519_007070 [Penicillium mononematosum]